LHGTCIEAPPQRIDSEDELFVVSYFSDIATNPDILALVAVIQQTVRKAIASIARYLARWKRYRSIWKVEKVSVQTFHITGKSTLFGRRALRYVLTFFRS